MTTHLLIDASNLIYRAHFASGLVDKNGVRVSGIFNSLKMIDSLVRKFQPDSVVIAWDKGKSKARMDFYPEYKAQRDKNRKEQDKIDIERQRTMLQEILVHLPVKQIAVQDIEADDVIGYLCEKLKGKKIIVSNDTDFIQLINKKVQVFLPGKAKLLRVSNVDQHLGFSQKHYTLWKSMMGDKSDNIKGIPGIGEKRATEVIVKGLRGGKKFKLSREEQAILDRNKYLIAIGAILSETDVELISKSYRKAKKASREPKFMRVRKYFVQLDFKYLLSYFEEFQARFSKLIRKGTNEKAKKEKQGSSTRTSKGKEAKKEIKKRR